MCDHISAFTHDDGFEFTPDGSFESSNTGNDDVATAALNSVALSDAIIINDNIWSSDNTFQHLGGSILTATFDEDLPAEDNVEGVNLDHETLVEATRCGDSDHDKAELGRVPAHGIEPNTNDQVKTADSDTVISPINMTEDLDIEALVVGTSQDPMSALDKYPVKTAAASEEAMPGVLFLACKGAPDAQGEVEDTGNDTVKAAVEGDNPASAVISRPPNPGKTYPQMRPSRGIHPIGRPSSPASVKGRHAHPLRPSREVQPIISQTVAMSVVIGIVSDCQTVPVRVADANMSESPSSERDPLLSPEPRKRAAAKQRSGTAKRAKQCDERTSLILIRPDHELMSGKALVSQNLRPRRPTVSSTEDAHCYRYDYHSVQRKCNDIQHDIDDLDIQLRRGVKDLQRRFEREVQELENELRAKYRSMAEKVQVGVDDLKNNFQSDSKALQDQLDMFKVDLKDAGLVDL